MEAREAIDILHPDTTAKALAEYRRLGGFKEIKKATDEACLLACEALEKQAPKNPYIQIMTITEMTKLFHTKQNALFADMNLNLGIGMTKTTTIVYVDKRWIGSEV